jgi:hypothetical protein
MPGNTGFDSIGPLNTLHQIIQLTGMPGSRVSFGWNNCFK